MVVGLGLSSWEQMWYWWHHYETEWTLWAMSMLPARIQRKPKACLSWVRSVTVASGTWIWAAWELAWYNVLGYLIYVVQNSQQGVLLERLSRIFSVWLTQFSGAAQSLGAGALLVNPWNIREMCGAIEVALNMPENERKERQRHNFTHVTTHTAQAWADTFVR
jgi:hypothetical protein